MSDNMKKLFKLMKDYNVPAFSLDNELSLTEDRGGFVIYYYGDIGSYISNLDDVFERMFNKETLEPGDENFTLLLCHPLCMAPANAYRLGVDY